ncbi:MAG: preprotein translocase subunit SecE [Lachnospiraceae bacterium]|nr:preprotein translocase subunit SecE [Lachnospiraceae bacterium]
MATSEKNNNTGSGQAVAAVSEKAGGFFKGVKAEFRKINWETRENVTKQTISVVAISMVLGIIIAVLDIILQYGVDFIVNIGG